MAQRKRGKRTPIKEGQKVDLTLVPDHGRMDFPSYYANFAYVSHTNSEIIADFCMVALPYSVDIETKQVRVPIKCRVVMPPKLMDGLIKALKTQQEKQQTTGKSEALAIPVDAAKKR